MAGCLGEEAEKTGKGTGRERIWHSAQRQKYCSLARSLAHISFGREDKEFVTIASQPCSYENPFHKKEML